MSSASTSIRPVSKSKGDISSSSQKAPLPQHSYLHSEYSSTAKNADPFVILINADTLFTDVAMETIRGSSF